MRPATPALERGHPPATRRHRRSGPVARRSADSPPPPRLRTKPARKDKRLAGRRRRVDLALGVLLAVATFVAYLPALDAGFIWDDDLYVVDNAQLRDAAGLARIWLEPSATPQYYPLVHTTFWLEYQAWGLAPAGYHAVNVVLHILAALLLWRVATRLQIPGAWLAAALFALHPVHVESVAWVTERKNVLSGVLFLAALLAYLRFRPLVAGSASADDPAAEAPAPRRGYVASLIFFAGALLSKTVTCSLPAVILVLTWWRRGRLRWRDVRPTIPMFALGAGLAAVTVILERTQVGARGDAWDLSFVERCLIAGRALFFYAGKLVWPEPLIFNYPRWTIDAGDVLAYLYPLAALAIAIGAWLARERIGRGPLAAGLLFAGVLLPALGFVDVYPMLYSFVADHFQYLASIALLTPIAAVATRAAVRFGGARRWAPLAALVLLALAILTWRQSRVYHDLETLWRDTLAKNPQAWLAHNNLGVLLYERGALAEAREHFVATLDLHPDYPPAHFNLAQVANGLGRLDEALHHLRRTVALEPTHARAHNNLGAALAARGQAAEAIEHLRRAAELEPTYGLAHANLGDALLSLDRPREAAAAYAVATRLDAGDRRSARRHAVALERSGDLRGAIAVLRQQLDVESDDLAVLDHLARLLATAPGLDAAARDEAIGLAERACAITADEHPALLGTLATSYAAVGRLAAAEATLRRAIDRARLARRPRLEQHLRDQLSRLRARPAGR